MIITTEVCTPLFYGMFLKKKTKLLKSINNKKIFDRIESRLDKSTVPFDYKSQAKGNEGLWFFVDYKSQADFKLFFVEYKSQADLKIYFVDYKSQAGWTSNQKKHLLY